MKLELAIEKGKAEIAKIDDVYGRDCFPDVKLILMERKAVLQTLISIAEGKCEHEEQNVINSDCVVCRMKVAEKGLDVLRSKLAITKAMLQSMEERMLKSRKIAERVNEDMIKKILIHYCPPTVDTHSITLDLIKEITK